jgi:hypothetical protein
MFWTWLAFTALGSAVVLFVLELNRAHFRVVRP